jgi:hypothetical protein
MKRVGLMITLTSESLLLALAMTIVLSLLGCGTLDQGPADRGSEGSGDGWLAGGQDVPVPDERVPGSKGFFPLDIGNRWAYAGELTIVVDGGPPNVVETREERRLIGTEERFGREYVLELRFDIDEDGDTLSPLWFRYRQDRAGFYTADIAGNEPPIEAAVGVSHLRSNGRGRLERIAGLWQEIGPTIRREHKGAYEKGWNDLCLKLSVVENAVRLSTGPVQSLQGPPGGVFPEEITLLDYPLHPGHEWIVRDDPFLISYSVESHDVLDLPAGRVNGYQIRIDNGLFGLNDRAYIWYGRAGFLGLIAHVETEILDPNGNPMGTLVFDEETFLESLDLVGKGRW